jgi:hypothetical protein
MKKMLFGGFAAFISLIMFSACGDLPPVNSTGEYDGVYNDTITLEADHLTYTSANKKGPKTLDVTITQLPPKGIEGQYDGKVEQDERILRWIISPDDPSLLYGFIYCSIETDSEGNVKRDIPPEKLMILAGVITTDLDLLVRSPYTYIRQ